MFKLNKYTKYYTMITDRAKGRILESYTERHHIIPQSLGGSNDNDNLVDLTAREHFICHWLLVKMTEGEDRSKMLYALNGMKAENRYQQRYSSSITARVYERYRIEHAKNHSERMKGKPAWNKGIPATTDQIEKNRQAALKRGPKSQETIEKHRLSRKGYRHTEATKEKQRLSQLGKVKGPQSEAHRKAIGDSIKGKPKKDGHADNVRVAVLGNVSINKDGLEKKVKRDTLDTWLAEGWQLGGRKRVKA